jgi:hypothetical protein
MVKSTKLMSPKFLLVLTQKAAISFHIFDVHAANTLSTAGPAPSGLSQNSGNV